MQVKTQGNSAPVCETEKLTAEEYRLIEAMRRDPALAGQAWAILTGPELPPVSQARPDAAE